MYPAQPDYEIIYDETRYFGRGRPGYRVDPNPGFPEEVEIAGRVFCYVIGPAFLLAVIVMAIVHAVVR